MYFCIVYFFFIQDSRKIATDVVFLYFRLKFLTFFFKRVVMNQINLLDLERNVDVDVVSLYYSIYPSIHLSIYIGQLKVLTTLYLD